MFVEVKCLKGECVVEGMKTSPVTLHGPGETAVYEAQNMAVNVKGEAKIHAGPARHSAA